MMARPQILVVDDNPDIREALAIALADHEYRVTTAESGPHALELIDAGLLPDVLLVDVEMPQMSGLELIERLAARPELSQTKAIVVSAMVKPPVIPAGTRWLGKFASLEYLIATVRAALASRTPTARASGASLG